MLETCAGSNCCFTSTSSVLALIITIIMVIKTINKIEELAIANNYLPKFKCLLAIHLPTIHLILLHAISHHFIFFYSPSNLDYLQFSIIRSCFLGTVPFFFREYFKIRCDLVIVLYNFYYYYFLMVK